MFGFKPSIVADLERENAVLRERERLITEHSQRLLVENAALARKYDRLVENRLFKTGEIASPITDTPVPSMRSPLASIFGNLGRTEMKPERVDDMVG